MARDIDVHDSTTIGTLHSLSPVAGQLRFQPSSTCKVQNHNVSAITVGAAKTNAVHFFNRCCTRVTQWDINTDQSAVHGHGGVVGDFRKGDVPMVTRIDRRARSIGDLQDIVRAVRARGASLIDTSTQPTNVSSILGVFTELETNLRKERQLEGIASDV